MINKNPARRQKSRRLKRLIGLRLLLSLLVVNAATLFGCSIDDVFLMNSDVKIWNRSGFDVQFEKVTIDGQIIWAKPDITIVSPKDLDRPWLDNRLHSIFLHFRAPKKLMVLEIVILNKIQEKEIVSCILDNRSRPCFFEAFYHKGKLGCTDCGKDFMD